MAGLTMVRGDTKVIHLTPYRDDEPIILEEGDILYLRVFEKDAVIISKDVTMDSQDPDSYAILVTLEPEDTESIELTKESTFRWEAEIVFADGSVLTPFHDRTLLIKPDKITPDKRGDS